LRRSALPQQPRAPPGLLLEALMHAVPASKTALKAILAARGAWTGVDIRDGQPTEQ
jgi:hypothetical protein